MKILLTTALLIALTGAPVSAQRKTAARPTILRLLEKREPEVKWNSQSLLKGDFDFDNIFDYALAGRKGDSFVVGIVKGRLSRKSKHWTLAFSDADADENSLCSAASAEIGLEAFSADDEIEELRNLSKNSRGINLADGLCDAFHIYYSQRQKRFVWWRN